MRRRQWWVCCYGFRPNFSKGTWVLAPNPFRNGWRQFEFVQVRTYKSLKEALESGAYNRRYGPFNQRYGIVVLMARAPNLPQHITEFLMYEGAEPWPRQKS